MCYGLLSFFKKTAEENHCVQVTQSQNGGIGIPSPDRGGTSCHLNIPVIMKDRAVFVCVSIISSFPGCTPGDTAMSYEHLTRFIYKETRFLAMLWKGSEKGSGPEQRQSGRSFKLSPEGHPP